MTRGRFIAFEGGEGSGKSTQIRLVADWLKNKKGLQVLMTREPGGSQLGEDLRNILLHSQRDKKIGSRSEALLFAAARAQHVEELILPQIEKGVWILCDRFIDASLAYQGVGRELGIQRLREINIWATDFLLPDRSYILDIDPVDGLNRAKDRAKTSTVDSALDRIESEKISFHRQIRQAYLNIASTTPSRYLVLNATLPKDGLLRKIADDIEKCLL